MVSLKGHRLTMLMSGVYIPMITMVLLSSVIYIDGHGPGVRYSKNLNTISKASRGALSSLIRDHERIYIPRRSLSEEHQRIRRDPDHQMSVKFYAYNKHFDLRLSHSNSLFAPDMQVEVVSDTGSRLVNFDRSKYFRGHVGGYSRRNSDVRAHIEDGRMRATINIEGHTYRLEPTSHIDHPYLASHPKHAAYDADNADFNHVVYSEEDIIADPKSESDDEHEFCSGGVHADEHPVPEFMQKGGGHEWTAGSKAKHTRIRRALTGNTCDMHIIADHRYFTSVGGSSTLTTQNKLIDMVENADQIFTFTSFDGVDKQIHLAIRKLTVFETASSTVLGFANPHAVDTTNSQTFLEQLAAVGHSAYCLAHTLTYQDFTGGVLGLAYVGTICAVPGGSGSSNNCGITTSLNQGAQSSALQTNIVFAHEVGHNFGMGHDNGCSTWCSTQAASACSACNGGASECVAGGSFGNFIMWPTAVDGLSANNDRFSGCSTLSAGTTINKDSNGGGYCFRDSAEAAICGNQVTETGEACDCGVLDENKDDPAFISFCNNIDPCCNTNCTLKPSAECSPKAGVCCDETCSRIGLDWSVMYNDTLQPFENVSNAADHLCRDPTECTRGGYCINDEEFQGACPSVNYPYDNATVDANDYTFHLETATTLCSANRATCLNGSCIGSLCAHFVSPLHVGNETVACTDATRPCAVACDFPGVGCVSSYDFATATELASNSFTVEPTLYEQDKPAGTTCAAFTGYCTDEGVCESVSVDSPLDLFKNIDVEAWIWDNWYIVVGLEVGIVLIAFVLRRANRQNDTSRWVHAQFKHIQDKLSDQVQEMFKPRQSSRRKSKMTTTRMKRRQKEQALKELAVVYGESRRLHVEGKMKRQREEAFARLKMLFPYCQDHVIRRMIQLSPDEEAAVGRLLTLGHAMWKVTDYKTLHYAVKRFKKDQKSKERRDSKRSAGSAQGPKDGGYLRVETGPPTVQRPPPPHHGAHAAHTPGGLASPPRHQPQIQRPYHM